MNHSIQNCWSLWEHSWNQMKSREIRWIFSYPAIFVEVQQPEPDDVKDPDPHHGQKLHNVFFSRRMDKPNHQQMISKWSANDQSPDFSQLGIAWIFYKGGSRDTAPVVWPRCIAPGAVLLPIAPGIWRPSQSLPPKMWILNLGNLRNDEFHIEFYELSNIVVSKHWVITGNP